MNTLMKSIFIGAESLRCLPSLTSPRHYDLRGGTEVIATLRWPTERAAVMKLPGGICVIQRGGLLWSEIAALHYGAFGKLMTFRLSRTGLGVADVGNLRRYTWLASGEESIWIDSQDQLLMTFKREMGTVALHLSPTIESCWELPELIALGCYAWVSRILGNVPNSLNER
jgi:hypothetical protein